MERELRLEIEELEQRIAPACLLEIPQGGIKLILQEQVGEGAANSPFIDCSK